MLDCSFEAWLARTGEKNGTRTDSACVRLGDRGEFGRGALDDDIQPLGALGHGSTHERRVLGRNPIDHGRVVLPVERMPSRN